ncbi:hypothetical protein [Thalassotalea sp. PS06]|uniref:hypothetical protein n=1 Tax=Thalassotalea sp. PS06 TaxID=2594005 RepID=UPI001162D148|nr:hypothetical protein [Thalassotalea sp. PS06]QDP02121.1 hypothetical protein FNC98_12690 [Thalassotalea sp. PS06]
MKKIYFLIAMFTSVCFANEAEQEQSIDTEFVKEVYEYCISMQSIDYLDKDLLLECINLELKYYEHVQFAKIEDIEKIARVEVAEE